MEWFSLQLQALSRQHRRTSMVMINSSRAGPGRPPVPTTSGQLFLRFGHFRAVRSTGLRSTMAAAIAARATTVTILVIWLGIRTATLGITTAIAGSSCCTGTITNWVLERVQICPY